MGEELKPVKCGCGGEAHHDSESCWNPEQEEWMPNFWHRVVCKNCGTQTKAFYTKAAAITAWNKAMGVTDTNVGDKFAKDINVPNKGFWKPVYESEATGFDPSLAGCDPVFNHVCSICGQETWANDLGEEYLSDFCPHCGADMRTKGNENV